MKKIGIVAALAIVFSGCSVIFKPQPSPTPEPTDSPRVQTLSFDPQAPLVEIRPKGDEPGLVIRIARVAEYQVIEIKVPYQKADGRTQGFLKTIRPNGQNVIEEAEIFGKRSRGVPKYDQDVVGGTVQLAFRQPDGTESFWETKFAIAEIAAGGTIRSPDGKLVFTSSQPTLVIIHKILGLAADLKGVDQDYGYAVSSSTGLIQGEVELTFFELPDGFDQLELKYWDGHDWQATETKRDRNQKRLSARITGSPVVMVRP